MNRFLATATLMLLISSTSIAYAQQSKSSLIAHPKTTPAYGVLVLRKVAAEVELQKMLSMVSDRHPDVKLKRYEIDVLDREMKRIRMIRKSSTPKLTTTYGMLILHQVAVEVELETLLGRVSEKSPDMINKRVELSILKREIAKVLQ